jgi:hypothetical protein
MHFSGKWGITSLIQRYRAGIKILYPQGSVRDMSQLSQYKEWFRLNSNNVLEARHDHDLHMSCGNVRWKRGTGAPLTDKVP